MKLAFCIPKYFPYGGLQRNFLRIAEHCQQEGHEIIVYTPGWEGEAPEGFRVNVIPVSRWLRNHTRNVVFARETQRLLAGERCDGVIGFLKMPGLDIYYAADPCFQAGARRQKSWIYRLDARYRTFVALERAVFRANGDTEILMLAETEIDNFRSCYDTPRERFHLLPPGIQKDRIAPAGAPGIRTELRQTFNLAGDEKLLLMVGSDFKRKGLDRTLRALAALPEALRDRTRLMVLGKSGARPFQRLARQLGIAGHVHFMGGRDDIPRFLLGADLLVHPAYSENTGNVLLEAMVAGLPVLTTANCGYAFHVERAGAGLVVPEPFRQEALNTSLLEMLTSAQAHGWAQNGIAYGRSQDLYSRPEAAAALIAEILERRKP